MSQEIESTQDIVNMSDADFMALDTPPVIKESEEAPESEVLDGEVEDELNTDPEGATEEEASASTEGGEPEGEEVDPEGLEEDGETDGESNLSDNEETDTTDFAAQIESLLAPFRANGKDMSVTSVDEARTLMQMGANYNKKMAGLKPNLKLMKMLQNNGLLDEGKLNYLIDLDKKDPKAISKLISDAKIDPLDIDVSSTDDYTANQYTVSDEQMNVDEVLEDIKGTKFYNETVELLGNTWDKASHDKITENPHVIREINEQMENGTYAKVSAEVERQRAFNGLVGLSDIEAYRQVGEQMYAAATQAQVAPANVSPTKVVIKAKQDPKLNAQRRAAGSTKSTPKTESESKDFNPLAMSDEDFNKLLAGGKFA
ncbi:MAG: hypothetical protein HRU18_02915 [Pseudoalteromonas sp.]|uniref:hypothetical protein n=1 Tax=Pseudoalteromonas sp. TaxID=53249 RepID=UPI001DBD7349|nr:hypothetical protein [Pseudoalteromonas sp.]NRA77136.1 hypothetical protein [Pseudoalteromonas sp.]